MRVTSPDGQFDAVMILESYGGALGGLDSYAYIVRKGKTALSSGLNPIFSAGTLDRENLVWKQPHLLEIQYDIGNIESFRNLWCSDEVENVGPSGEHNYCVEIRLAPSSPDFSIVNPAGGFRHR